MYVSFLLSHLVLRISRRNHPYRWQNMPISSLTNIVESKPLLVPVLQVMLSLHSILVALDISGSGELVYVVSMFEKALLGIVYSGHLAFLKKGMLFFCIVPHYETSSQSQHEYHYRIFILSSFTFGNVGSI